MLAALAAYKFFNGWRYIHLCCIGLVSILFILLCVHYSPQLLLLNPFHFSLFFARSLHVRTIFWCGNVSLVLNHFPNSVHLTCLCIMCFVVVPITCVPLAVVVFFLRRARLIQLLLLLYIMLFLITLCSPVSYLLRLSSLNTAKAISLQRYNAWRWSTREKIS